MSTFSNSIPRKCTPSVNVKPPPGMFERDGYGFTLNSKGMLVSYGPMEDFECSGPWKKRFLEAAATGSAFTSDKHKIDITLDLRQYRPEEVTAKTVDNFLIIEGKQEEKEEGIGYVSRQFCRRYALPENCPGAVFANFSPDGFMTVMIPKNKPTIKNEKKIHITRNPFPRINMKTLEQEQCQEDE